jgi:hypothetical protein
MESTPALTAALIPSVPWACAATFRSSMWAVSTAVLSSSVLYCWAPAVSPTEMRKKRFQPIA